jgi:hypothetical protein
MKKVIAFLLAVLYFVFTTFTLWQVNDADSRLGQTAHENGITTADAEPGRELNTDILADKPLNRTPKHLNVTGKRNLPRASCIALSFKSIPSFSTAALRKQHVWSGTPLLYQASIYLRNRVLLI